MTTKRERQLDSGLTVSTCACGAITVATREFSNSMRPATFKREFPDLAMPRKATWSCCNHCVNHWGIDLCGCGCGQKVGRCNGGFRQCRSNIPAQEKGQRKEFVGWRF